MAIARHTSLPLLRLAAFAFGAMLFAWATVALAAPKVIGITSAVVNDVRIRPASVSTYAKAKLRQRVALADRVRTGEKSRLQLLLLDRTKFSVGANAELVIDRFVYDPNGGSVSASVAKGAFRFMSGSSRSATKTVNTPSATIGIRGTVFDAAVGAQAVAVASRERAVPQDTRHDPLTATLVVLRGPGPNRQAGLPVGLVDVTGGGQTVTLDAPLLAAYVPYQGAAPIGPFPISLTGLAQLSDFILAPPDRDFEPFTQDDIPFRNDRPRGPPPVIFQNGGDGPGPGYDRGYRNDGFTPGMNDLPDMPRDRPGTRMPDPSPTPSPRQPAGATMDPQPAPMNDPQSAPSGQPLQMGGRQPAPMPDPQTAPMPDPQSDPYQSDPMYNQQPDPYQSDPMYNQQTDPMYDPAMTP